MFTVLSHTPLTLQRSLLVFVFLLIPLCSDAPIKYLYIFSTCNDISMRIKKLENMAVTLLINQHLKGVLYKNTLIVNF